MIPGVWGSSVGSFLVLSGVLVACISLVLFLLWQRFVLRPAMRRKRLKPSFVPYLILLWILLICYGEVGVHLLHACRFASSDEGTHRVLVLADPQITDPWAYPFLPYWTHGLIAFVCDMQLRRSFHAAVWKAAPDVALILGDLFWGAPRYTTIGEWSAGLKRLNAIFGPPQDLTLAQMRWKETLPVGNGFEPRVPTGVIAGNHDVWMYSCDSKLNLPELFKETFGALNFRASVDSSFEIVGVASPLLQDRECKTRVSHQEVNQRCIEWVKSFTPLGADTSVIALSHIPLAAHARWSGQCNLEHHPNARRRDFKIRPGRGVGYENVLSDDLTKLILEHLKPTVVLSGDAHDLCEAILDDAATWDITLPSFSWLEGTLHHGYALMEIRKGKPKVAVCWQPQQIFIYSFYGVAFAASLLYLTLSCGIYRDIGAFLINSGLLVMVSVATFALCGAFF